MKKLFLIFISVCITTLIFGQQIDCSYLNPKAGAGTDYKYLRFGSSTEYYGGLMWNNTSVPYGNGNDLTLYTYGNRDITLMSGTGNVIVFPSSGGKMGIGTTSPSEKLDVHGNIQGYLFRVGATTNANGMYATYELNDIRFNRTNGPSYIRQQGNNALLFTCGPAESQSTVLTLYPSKNARFENNLYIMGNVGIGTTSPGYKLEIQTSKNDLDGIKINNASGESNAKTGINFLNGPNNMGSIYTVRNDNSFVFQNNQTVSKAGFIFMSGNNEIMRLTPDAKLYIKQVEVSLNSWPDFVFENSYKLMPLKELENFIKTQKHLPDIAPAKEIEQNGADIGNLSSKLIQKVEELTLYTIKQDKQISEQDQKNKKLEEVIDKQQQLLEQQQKEIETLKQQQAEIEQLKEIVKELQGN